MVVKYSNTAWLTILEPPPIEGLGWECVVRGHDDFATIVARINRFRSLSGSLSQNDFGSGTLELDFDDPVLASGSLPTPYTGSLVQKEYLYEFFEDGVRRHQWLGEDIEEDVATEDGTRVTKISGRTVEKVLEWGIHVPEYMEYQTVKIGVEADSGVFSLRFGSEYTTDMAYNISASGMETALKALTAIGPNDVIVEKEPEVNDVGATTAWVWALKFVGKYIEGNVFAPGVRLKSGNTVMDTTPTPDVSVAIDISEIESIDYYATYDGHAAAGWLAELGRAKARGVLGFVTPSFTATEDSSAQPWLDSAQIEFQNGETLLDLLKRLSDLYGWEFRMMPGFKLQVAQDGFGQHRESEVVFWLGGHQQSQKRRRSTREMATTVYAVSEDEYVAKATGVSTASPHIREAWVEAGGANSTGEAQKVANATVSKRLQQAVEREVKVPYGVTDHRLFLDFGINDYVSVEDEWNEKNGVKLLGIAWTVDQDAQIDLELTIDG